MNSNQLQQLIYCTSLPPHNRTPRDLEIISFFLRKALHGLPNINSICRTIRHEKKRTNDILFKHGDPWSSWYLLINGSVLLDDESLVLPCGSFGKRSNQFCKQHTHRCLILEDTDLLVIDYVDSPGDDRPIVTRRQSLDEQSQSSQEVEFHRPAHRIKHAHKKRNDSCGSLCPQPDPYLRPDPSAQRNSRASDTSSAYSGSDNYGGDDNQFSDDDMDASSLETQSYRDFFMESITKEPKDRTLDDLANIVNTISQIAAYEHLASATLDEIARVVLLANVREVGKVILADGELLDSWSVLYDGEVEIEDERGQKGWLSPGHCFGVKPTSERQHHRGTMRAMSPCCVFLVVKQEDYVRLMKHDEDYRNAETDESGRIVAIVEFINEGDGNKGRQIKKATVQRLIEQLCYPQSTVNANYEDIFFLMYRTFLDSPQPVIQFFTRALDNTNTLRNLIRVIPKWVNLCFNDFEDDIKVHDFLENFMRKIRSMKDQLPSTVRWDQTLDLLYLACSANANERIVSLDRSSDNEPLFCFITTIKGGKSQHFVSKVERKARAKGLRVGDCILKVNDASVTCVTREAARKLLIAKNEIVLLVKNDLRGYDRALKDHHNESHGSLHQQQRSINGGSDSDQLSFGSNSSSEKGFPEWHQLDQVVRVWYNPGGGTNHIDKLIPIYEEATSDMVCQLAVKEFNLSPKDLYRLCKVSVKSGRTVCVSVLREDTTSLMDSINLNERYYLKNMTSTGPVISDEVAVEIWRDSRVSIKKSDGCERIDPREMAIKLTLDDFDKFKRICATEYVCRFFRKSSNNLFPNYNKFCDTQGEQHNWVLSELISSDASSRAEVAKFFIHVAKWCRKFRNFNSMFAILTAVSSSRLPCTKFMDKLPGKLRKTFDTLMETINPDRNWKRYRELLGDQPPTIPIVSVLQKDLFSIYDSNDLYSKEQPSLVNFQFLRRYAESVLFYRRMCEINYDVESMRRSSTDESSVLSLGANNGESIGMKLGAGAARSRSQVARQASALYQKWLIGKRIETYFSRLHVMSEDEMNAARATAKKAAVSSTGSVDTVDMNAARKLGAQTNDDARKLFSLSSNVKESRHPFLPEPPREVRRHNVHSRTPSLPASMESAVPTHKVSTNSTSSTSSNSSSGADRRPPPYSVAIERQKEQSRHNNQKPPYYVKSKTARAHSSRSDEKTHSLKKVSGPTVSDDEITMI